MMAKRRDLAFKIKLVEAVEKHPCLYNYNLREYGKYKPTQLAWENIAKEANDTLMNCEETWKSIKIGYMLYITNKSETAAAKKYYLKDKMQFIRPYLNLGTGICSSMLEDLPSTANDRNIAQDLITLAEPLKNQVYNTETKENVIDTWTDEDYDNCKRGLVLEATMLLKDLNTTQKNIFYREVVGYIDDLLNANVDADVIDSKMDKLQEMLDSPRPPPKVSFFKSIINYFN